LELELDLPPQSTTLVSLAFDKMLLRYTEYPPDANRGFDIGSAMITLLPQAGDTTSNNTKWRQIFTQNLLVSLPTPDFSMPYNVITLTSTVIALFFGSLYNMLVRRFRPIPYNRQSLLKRISNRIAVLFRRNRSKNTAVEKNKPNKQ
jgi:phosphatidylinositol glycan class T